MSANVGYVTMNVLPSAKGFGKALKGDIDPALASAGDSAGNTLGSKLKSVAAPLFALAGTVAMGAFVKNAITEAGKLEQSIGAIDTVFKASSIQVHAWAVNAAKDTGLARNEYNELATLIGSQLKNAGTAMDELGPKTNDLITLGADLSSMFGGTSREAVEALSAALKGERDPIERYGVSLNQAAIDAKAAELGFSKVGGTLSKEANAAATLALIMDQTADAHGNFAKEATTYEGVGQRLAASWANITATIGAGFLPFATAAKSVLLAMMPAVQSLAYGFSTFGESMTYAFQEAGGGIAGIKAMFSEAFASLATWLAGDGLTALIDGYYAAQLGLVTFITENLPAIAQAIANGISQAAVGISTSMGTILTEAVPALLTGLQTVISALAAALPQIIAALSTSIRSAVPLILQAGIELFFGIVQAVVTVLPDIVTAVLDMLVQLVTLLAGQISLFLEAGIQLFMTLIQAIVTIAPQIIDVLLNQVLPTLLTTLLTMLPQLLATGIELFMSLVQAVLDVLPELLNTLLVEVLPNVLTTLLGMLPQLLTTGFELFMMLVQAVLKMLPQLLRTLLVDVLPAVLKALVKMIPDLLVGAVDLFMMLVEGVLDMLPELLHTIIFEVIPQVIDALIDAIPDLLQAGKDLLQGLIDGFWKMAKRVGEALINIISDAVDGFLGFLGIHSPSRLFKSFGVNVGEGLALGLDSMQSDVAKSALGLATAAADAVDGMSLAMGADISGAVPDGGLYGAASGGGRGSSQTLNYTQNGGQGLTSEQELIKAARRLKPTQ